MEEQASQQDQDDYPQRRLSDQVRALNPADRETVRRLISPQSALLEVGTDPDYRYTLANERTFLAWIRTALALIAGGLGALHLIPDAVGSEVVGLGLLSIAFYVSASSFRRWYRNEEAIRKGRPLPTSRLPQVMAYSMAIIAVATATFFVLGEI